MSISKATETKLKQTIATLREQLNAAHHLIGTQNKQIVQLRNDYFAASESCSNALADLRELQNNVASEIPTIRQLTNENANLKRMLADAIYAIGMEDITQGHVVPYGMDKSSGDIVFSYAPFEKTIWDYAAEGAKDSLIRAMSARVPVDSVKTSYERIIGYAENVDVISLGDDEIKNMARQTIERIHKMEAKTI
ncbi:MAG: hypothetical protein PHW79_06085 [Candidatus Marinimicrobia bacterium]|nr:hypothetical protein [Candidatus Neomarinimicrobiota bacterium]